MSSKHSAAAHALASDVVVETLDKHASELTDLRRDLHAHPELSWHESRTSAIVADRLTDAGWTVRRLNPTGVLADLGEGGGLVGLRADLDALPVQDFTDDPWTSTSPGVAHAC